MQAQDTATAYFFKLWSWVETNIKQVLMGLGVVVVAIALVSYYFWRQNQLEIDAGQALTQVVVSSPGYSEANQLIDAYSKVAADYPGTQSGQRALILGATALFEGGKYPEAQAQFQKYLDTCSRRRVFRIGRLGGGQQPRSPGESRPRRQPLINGW